ncbi:hypothetical protein [Burkholderia gladioli]|uniref:hypothetical protein n=1 Tax=Burkholderia gladioli TaxID=28095 RepID=UPI001640BBF1|nr:hypothetical protein [Burkholderia gladioli]
MQIPEMRPVRYDRRTLDRNAAASSAHHHGGRQVSRYPYTEACDYIRAHVTDYDETLGVRVPTISRSQASLARLAIARALGMDDEELARKIADYARSQEDGK